MRAERTDAAEAKPPTGRYTHASQDGLYRAIGELKTASRSLRTVERYDHTLRTFHNWRVKSAQSADRDLAELVTAFVVSRSALSHQTLMADLAALRAHYVERGVDDPTGAARRYVCALLRQTGRRGEVNPIDPMSPEDVAAMLGAIKRPWRPEDDDWFEDLKNRVAGATLYTTARRAHDLSMLRIEDAEALAEGPLLWLPQQKTDQERHGEELAIGHVDHQIDFCDHCLACALNLYILVCRRRQPNATGPLFPKGLTHTTDAAPMAASDFSRVVKKYVTRAGRFASRSGRKGAATALNDAGEPVAVIADHLNHRSIETTHRYIVAEALPLVTSGTNATLPCWAPTLDIPNFGISRAPQAVESGSDECLYIGARFDKGPGAQVNAVPAGPEDARTGASEPPPI